MIGCTLLKPGGFWTFSYRLLCAETYTCVSFFYGNGAFTLSFTFSMRSMDGGNFKPSGHFDVMFG